MTIVFQRALSARILHYGSPQWHWNGKGRQSGRSGEPSGHISRAGESGKREAVGSRDGRCGRAVWVGMPGVPGLRTGSWRIRKTIEIGSPDRGVGTGASVGGIVKGNTGNRGEGRVAEHQP